MPRRVSDRQTGATQEPEVFDHDNPEWTEADFSRAKPASSLPAHILKAFPEDPWPSGRCHQGAGIDPADGRGGGTLQGRWPGLAEPD